MSNEGASKESPPPRTATQRSALRRNATQRFLILEGGMKITKLSPAQGPATRRPAAQRSATQRNGRSLRGPASLSDTGFGMPRASTAHRSASLRHATQLNATAGPFWGRHPQALLVWGCLVHQRRIAARRCATPRTATQRND